MRKASRLFEIIQILRLARKPMTAAKMAETLEVTVRSIYRDIAALQAMRVPIEGGRGIGYIMRPGFDLPPLMFSIEEMEAIVLSLALLDRTADEELKQAARRVNQKISGAVPPPLRQAMDNKVLLCLGLDRAAGGFRPGDRAPGDPRRTQADARLPRRTRPRHRADDPAGWRVIYY